MIIDDIIFVFIIFVVVVVICIAVVRISNNNNTDGNVHFAVDYNNRIKFKNLPTGGNQGLYTARGGCAQSTAICHWRVRFTIV